MPGNDFDGGFASHIKVPFKYLCSVPDKVLKKYSLEQLAVIADAVTTPYQALKKSKLEEKLKYKRKHGWEDLSAAREKKIYNLENVLYS